MINQSRYLLLAYLKYLKESASESKDFFELKIETGENEWEYVLCNSLEKAHFTAGLLSAVTPRLMNTEYKIYNNGELVFDSSDS
jgi:hypothetical protein